MGNEDKIQVDNIEIIYEDKDIIVCRKPSGIAVQSARPGQMDMESQLKNYRNGGYVGIVQRLDQPVEGVLVFGKTPAATAALNRQHQNGQMKKQYLAVFCGTPASWNGQFVDYLLKDGKQNRSYVVKEGTPGSKKAILDYHIKAWKDSVGLAEIRLLTGRHHQIRVQMAYHGMPLWGDGKYHPDGGKENGDKQLGLCSWRLELKHPGTGKKMYWEIKPQGNGFRKFQETVSIETSAKRIL